MPRAEWSEEAAELLVNLWMEDEFQTKLKKGGRHTTKVWKVLVATLNKTMESAFTVQQVKTKVDTLVNSYKKARKKNKDSGEGANSSPFYDQIDMVFGHRPMFNQEARKVLDTSAATGEEGELSAFATSSSSSGSQVAMDEGAQNSAVDAAEKEELDHPLDGSDDADDHAIAAILAQNEDTDSADRDSNRPQHKDKNKQGKGGNLALAGRRHTKGGQQRMIFGQAASFVKEMFTTFNQENQEREAKIRRQEMEEERRERDRERQHQAEVESAEREKERRFRAEQAQLDREAEEWRFSMLAQGISVQVPMGHGYHLPYPSQAPQMASAPPFLYAPQLPPAMSSSAPDGWTPPTYTTLANVLHPPM